MVYHGPAARSLGYFAAHGYECEEHDNPADFFLDVILQNEEAVQKSLAASAVWQNGTAGVEPSPLYCHRLHGNVVQDTSQIYSCSY